MTGVYMKILFISLLVLVASCDSKEKSCKLDPIANTGAMLLAAQYGCDVQAVTQDFKVAVRKLPMCSDSPMSNLAGNEILGNLKCNVLPMIANRINEGAAARWKCKTKEDVAIMIKKALKCK